MIINHLQAEEAPAWRSHQSHEQHGALTDYRLYHCAIRMICSWSHTNEYDSLCDLKWILKNPPVIAPVIASQFRTCFFYLPMFFSLVKLMDNTTIPIMATIPNNKLKLQQIVVNFSFFTELAYSVFSFVWSISTISTISTISVGIGIKGVDQQAFAEKVSKYRVVDVLYTRFNR